MNKFKCEDCGWIGNEDEVLVSPNPFDPADQVCGCPKCQSVQSMQLVCDEPGCAELATCGFPVGDGYRHTCGKHSKWSKE